MGEIFNSIFKKSLLYNVTCDGLPVIGIPSITLPTFVSLLNIRPIVIGDGTYTRAAYVVDEHSYYIIGLSKVVPIDSVLMGRNTSSVGMGIMILGNITFRNLPVIDLDKVVSTYADLLSIRVPDGFAVIVLVGDEGVMYLVTGSEVMELDELTYISARSSWESGSRLIEWKL